MIEIPLDLLKDSGKSIEIAMPKSCLKEQNGCGRELPSTTFALKEVKFTGKV